MSDFDELLPAFIEESQQHLQTVEPDILALEQGGGSVDRETVNRIFRGIHSIKGASGFFGLQNISELSHVIENSLALLRDGKIAPSSELIDALLKGVDTLRTMLDNVSGSEKTDIRNEVAQLQKILDNTVGPQRKVFVAEKSAESKKKDSDAAVNKFNVSESEIRDMVRSGLHLYAIKIFLDRDLRKKNKTPYNFINTMESLGRYVDSFLDILSVTGLSDCLSNDLAFDFLFATGLKPLAVAEGLGLPDDRVTLIDLDEFRKETHIREKARISEIPATEKQSRDSEPVIPEETAPAPDRSESGREDAGDTAAEDMSESVRSEDTQTGSGTRVTAEEKIRVGVNFLNDLVNLAGELVLGRNQLIQTTIPLVKHTPGLNTVLQHINRVTSEMQEKIMQMRMQPISLIFGKFHRLVRSLAKNHNKEVKLFTYGDEVELDKSIIGGLSDPLTHLIRNAVDHGIELPEEREKAGKPRHGTIEIKVFHQGGQVHLMVSDDGRGVDGKFVARKAVEKGMIHPDQMNSMSEKDRVRLIFMPGFSTAEKVTDLSGRGVGMDVVITNIEHLGGTVDIDTKPGRGTTVILVLPLTLAIISGLLIRSEDQFFLLPEVDIDELVRIKPDEIKHRINAVQDALVLRLREMLLPLVKLNEVLGISAGVDETKPLRILVIKHGSSRFGIIADSIESTEEIVVKPLPRYLKKIKCFSGVTILGNGKVSLILDVAGILRKADIRHLEENKDDMRSDMGKSSVEAETQTLLLFDNNTRERFALPLELISRIERVSASRIEYIKDRQFLQYHDKKLRLIFLEDYLPVSRPERSPDDTVCVIVPKQTKHPLGIVMNRVINTVNTAVELDTTTVISPGLFGSAVLENRITLLPDMYRLFEMAAPEWYEIKKSAGICQARKCRILLAEDTPFFRMVEKDYLTSAGYEVLTAEDGKKAMQILEEEIVDAVILDIVMPKMDGWDTIRAIRADERLARLPVMAVTSLSDEGLEQKGLEAGFTEWELKLNKTRLLEKLSAMLACREA